MNFNKNWRKNINVAEADLVSILTNDEQQMLLDEFKKRGLYNGKFWIGLTKQNSSRVYWTDGTYYRDYANWKGASQNASCVISAVSDGKWDAAVCSEKNNYVCKVARGKKLLYSNSINVIMVKKSLNCFEPQKIPGTYKFSFKELYFYTQQAFICSKLTIVTLEEEGLGIKYDSEYHWFTGQHRKEEYQLYFSLHQLPFTNI